MIEVVKYISVNDFGTVINPLMVEGQVHGGVVQGIGQALMEHTVYDEDGQLLTGSFMDYAMPRAADAPSFATANHPVPATTNPLGVKGCGEAGCAGSLVSVMNAIADALADFGVRHHRYAGDAGAGVAGDPGRRRRQALAKRIACSTKGIYQEQRRLVPKLARQAGGTLFVVEECPSD